MNKIDQVINNEDITYETVVKSIASAYRNNLLEDVKNRKKDVRETNSLSVDAKRKKYNEIDRMQSERLKNSEIINAADVIKEVSSLSKNIGEMENFNQILALTKNDKAIKTLKSQIEKTNISKNKKYLQADAEIQKMKDPDHELAPTYIEQGDGYFNMVSDISLISSKTPDGYKKLFEIALNNEDIPKVLERDLSEVNQEKYESDKSKDFKCVEELFSSDILQEFIGEMSKTDPKRANTFNKIQKRQTKALGKIQKDQNLIDETISAKKSVSEALKELADKSSYIPENVFASLKSDLEKQNEELTKKLFKIEKKRDKKVSKSGLEDTVKNAKAYHSVKEEIENSEKSGVAIKAENRSKLIEEELKTAGDDVRKKLEYEKEEMDNKAWFGRKNEFELKNKLKGIVAFEVLNSTAKNDAKIALPDGLDIENIAKKGEQLNHIETSKSKSKSLSETLAGQVKSDDEIAKNGFDLKEQSVISKDEVER